MATLSIQLAGLKEVVESLDPKKYTKGVAIGIGRAFRGLHKEMSFAITKTYNAPRKLDAVLITPNKGSSVKFGQNVISAGLQYRFKAEDMSKYPYTFYMGNINPANRQGPVHVVEIKRGRKVIVKGKEHRGGFVPRPAGKGKRAIQFGRFGSQMFERKSRRQLPVRVLYGPSMTKLASMVFDYDSGVQAYKAKIVDIIRQELPE